MGGCLTFHNWKQANIGYKECPNLDFFKKILIAGQTALHIAAVNQNVHLVKCLLKKRAHISTPRATGHFFRRNSSHRSYFGMIPSVAPEDRDRLISRRKLVFHRVNSTLQKFFSIPPVTAGSVTLVKKS